MDVGDKGDGGGCKHFVGLEAGDGRKDRDGVGGIALHFAAGREQARWIVSGEGEDFLRGGVGHGTIARVLGIGQDNVHGAGKVGAIFALGDRPRGRDSRTRDGERIADPALTID